MSTRKQLNTLDILKISRTWKKYFEDAIHKFMLRWILANWALEKQIQEE